MNHPSDCVIAGLLDMSFVMCVMYRESDVYDVYVCVPSTPRWCSFNPVVEQKHYVMILAIFFHADA